MPELTKTRTILHVEDDSNDVLLFQHACQRAGVTSNLQCVCDGDEALAYLTRAGKFDNAQRYPAPDLVLLDLKMPRLNGFEVLAWIRKSERLRRLPVIVLSSSNHQADVQQAYEAGANSFLVKPVDFNSLVELVGVIHKYWLDFNEQPEL